MQMVVSIDVGGDFRRTIAERSPELKGILACRDASVTAPSAASDSVFLTSFGGMSLQQGVAEMDPIAPEIFYALNDLEALVPCTEAEIFRKLGQLDKQYLANPDYSHNINGILVNIGADLVCCPTNR